MANRILTCRNEYMQINRDALLSAFTRLLTILIFTRSLNVFDNENYVNSNCRSTNSTFTLSSMSLIDCDRPDT